MSPLLKNIAGPIKSLHITGSPPPQKNLPGRQFAGKNPPRLGGRRAGGFWPENCRPGETFWGRSYNGTPATRTDEFIDLVHSTSAPFCPLARPRQMTTKLPRSIQSGAHSTQLISHPLPSFSLHFRCHLHLHRPSRIHLPLTSRRQ